LKEKLDATEKELDATEKELDAKNEENKLITKKLINYLEDDKNNKLNQTIINNINNGFRIINLLLKIIWQLAIINFQ
jgi:hypothetical protein